MSKVKFSIHSPEGRKLMWFCGFALVFSATVLLFTFDVSFAGLIPSEAKLDDLRREEKKAIAAWRNIEAKQKEQFSVDERYQKLLDSAWVEARDGSPDVEIPKQINSIAKKYEIELSGVSAVRRNRINNELSALEMDVNTAAPLSALTGLWLDVRRQTPIRAWKRMDLRPETVQNSDRVFFSGTLRILFREVVADSGKSAGKGGAR